MITRDELIKEFSHVLTIHTEVTVGNNTTHRLAEDGDPEVGKYFVHTPMTHSHETHVYYSTAKAALEDIIDRYLAEKNSPTGI